MKKLTKLLKYTFGGIFIVIMVPVALLSALGLLNYAGVCFPNKKSAHRGYWLSDEEIIRYQAQGVYSSNKEIMQTYGYKTFEEFLSKNCCEIVDYKDLPPRDNIPPATFNNKFGGAYSRIVRMNTVKRDQNTGKIEKIQYFVVVDNCGYSKIF